MMIRSAFILLIAFGALSITGCKEKPSMQDGYYTAQASEYSHGWKEFVTITVKQDKIIAVDYNAENESGFIKSWDNAYKQDMLAVHSTYPNEYTRYYAAQLLSSQSPEKIDAISGASTSYSSFKILADAAVRQAGKGDSSIILVDTE